MTAYTIDYDAETGICKDTSTTAIPDSLKGVVRKAGFVFQQGARAGNYIDRNAETRGAAITAFINAGHTLALTSVNYYV